MLGSETKREAERGRESHPENPEGERTSVESEMKRMIDDELLPPELHELAIMYYGIDSPRKSLKAIRRELSVSPKKLKEQVRQLENKVFNFLKK